MEAFDLERESDVVRDRYGRTQFGQGCLLARRMIERGVPYVEVSNWDTPAWQLRLSRTSALSSTALVGGAAWRTGRAGC
ncbi:MAG: DUF1501 domain-containing protein [Planctomycetaceae bacterium]